jgi:hypothetical protein
MACASACSSASTARETAAAYHVVTLPKEQVAAQAEELRGEGDVEGDDVRDVLEKVWPVYSCCRERKPLFVFGQLCVPLTVFRKA